MPMHDWTRVEAGIYHAFHHAWILELHRAMLRLLPAGYYSLPEQKAGGFGPDVLALSTLEPEEPDTGGATATLTRPHTRVFQESEADFYLRKQKVVVIRHVSGDRIVAVIEVVSPANKNSAHGLRSFLAKARELLEKKVHLLLIDPLPVDDRVPFGLHHLIADAFLDDPFQLPPESPLSLVAYECADTLRAYLEPFAVGDALPDMPIFLRPERFVSVPLEATYQAAWATVPPRWQRVIEATSA